MVRPVLLLMRAPLAGSAISNTVTGYLLERPPARAWGLGEVLLLALVGAASACLYWGGMVLNDLFDRERDRTLFPGRPIPSGRVAAGTALALGLAFLGVGVALTTAAGALAGVPAGPLGAGGALRGLLGGAAVAACVLAYDGGLKRYRLPGSVAMGACRLTNALSGAWVLGVWPEGGVAGPATAYAVLLLLYVASLTVLSTYEEEDAAPAPLAAAWAGVLLGPVAATGAVLLLWGRPEAPHPAAWVGLVPLLAIVLGQVAASVARGTQATGQARTRTLLKSIWLIDLSALLGFGPWAAVPALAPVYVAGTLGARALFRPPPQADPGPPGTDAAPGATLDA